jgi:putative aminopeptidase FrvX
MSLEPNSIKLLKELSEAFGPSGFEKETAAIVKRTGIQYSDEVLSDKLGSVVFKKAGTKQTPKILMAGHMDEVGFVVTGIDEDTGFLTFGTLGGWFDQVLLGHRVIVRTRKGDVVGIIAAKPPHLLTEDERKVPVKKENMYIDVGADNKSVAQDELGIAIGDPVAPWTPFTQIRNGKVVVGKAFDDRIGTFVGLEVLRRLHTNQISHPNTVYVGGTVQEEVGLRGATTVAQLVDADVAIALEVDIAGDVPGIAQRGTFEDGKGAKHTYLRLVNDSKSRFQELCDRYRKV